MSKKKYKQYVEEFNDPSAKIPYPIYVKILKNEFSAVEGKRSHTAGSKRSFTITVGDRTIPFVIHEPHRKDKDGYVGKWDHHNVLYILELLGLITIKRKRDEEEKG